MPAPGTYRLDPSRSVVDVTIRQFWAHRIRARIPAESGQLIVNRKDPLASWVRVDLCAGLISTGLAARDEALRGPEVLDCANHPWIRFESTATEVVGEGRWQVDGDLYVQGRIAPLALTARAVEITDERIVVAAEGSLRWSELNLGWESVLERSGLLGRTLNVFLAAEFSL